MYEQTDVLYKNEPVIRTQCCVNLQTEDSIQSGSSTSHFAQATTLSSTHWSVCVTVLQIMPIQYPLLGLKRYVTLNVYYIRILITPLVFQTRLMINSCTPFRSRQVYLNADYHSWRKNADVNTVYQKVC